MTRGSASLGLTGSILEAAGENGERFLVEGGGRAIAIGVLLSLLSAVANGSFAVFSKTRSIRRAHVSPLIFNFWACLGVVLSSFLVLFKFRFVFAMQGLLSGLFFVLSFINSFRAVRLIGVSVSYGIWAGTATLVSFLAREMLEGASGRSMIMVFAGLATTLVGIVGVAWSGHMGWEPHDIYDDDDRAQSLIQSQPSFAGWVQHRRPSNVADHIKRGAIYQNGSTANLPSRSFSAGVFSAVLAGILGGLVMVPAIGAPESAKDHAFLPSFGIAVAIFTPVATSLPYLSSSCEIPDFAAQDAAAPGIFSGFLWNLGNILGMMAVFYVGSAVAYPLLQCGIIIAGIWGILYFEELSGNALVTFWAAGLLVLAGIILLSITP